MGERTIEGSITYLDLARFVAEWQRDRAEAFEHKAVAVLGFIGVVMALLPRLLPFIGDAHGGFARTTLKWVLAGSAATLAGSGFASMRVLWPRRVAGPVPLSQFQEMWDSYRKSGDPDDELGAAALANMLIGQADDRPLASAQALAEWRATAFAWASTLMFAAVTLLAAFLVLLIFTRG